MDARLGNCGVFLQLCLKVQEIILRYPLFLDWYITISFVCHYKTEKTERNFSKGIIQQKKLCCRRMQNSSSLFLLPICLARKEREKIELSARGEKRTTKHFRSGRISVPSLKKIWNYPRIQSNITNE